MLDPRISYLGLKDDALRDHIDGQENLLHINKCRDLLQTYFTLNYYRRAPTTRACTPTQPESQIHGSPQRFNFISRYSTNVELSTSDDELDEYFRMKPHQDWASGEPIIWWSTHAAQFPQLSAFARDILSIPGGWNHEYCQLL